MQKETVKTVVVRDSSFLGRNGNNIPALRRIIDEHGTNANGLGAGRLYPGDWTEVLPGDGWTPAALESVEMEGGF